MGAGINLMLVTPPHTQQENHNSFGKNNKLLWSNIKIKHLSPMCSLWTSRTEKLGTIGQLPIPMTKWPHGDEVWQKCVVEIQSMLMLSRPGLNTFHSKLGLHHLMADSIHHNCTNNPQNKWIKAKPNLDTSYSKSGIELYYPADPWSPKGLYGPLSLKG